MAPSHCLISGEMARKGSATVLWELPSAQQPLIDKIMVQLFKLGKIIATNTHKLVHSSHAIEEIDSCIQSLSDEYYDEAFISGRGLEYPDPGHRKYRDATTAVTLTYFATARILLSMISDWPDTLHMPIMEENHQTILDCVGYLFTLQGNSLSTFLPLLLPITLVAMHSSSREHRQTALTMIKSRSQHSIFGGLAMGLAMRIVQTGPSAY